MDYGALIIIVGSLFGMTILVLSFVERTVRRLARQTLRIETKLDAMLDSLGIAAPRPELARVNSLILEGKRIQAIKEYRKHTGATLAEAKQAIEDLERRGHSR
ncbi:ribosomal protein L7/L12 [Saccharomonospora amisosensis]|uniref:Ribosomal protein L7/L12 n=1 Tax=Saccharomonospora amisosensis TaxID=1128677 RepID=A0A7X5UMY3_9PSEU|nr:hypothetical protein [Saccharomonospora amisosensis]NIJ10687.1 ribosomal protein L7/L12 [Saccharomonospora amisosensis]